MGVSGRKSSPPLSQPGRCARRFKRPVHFTVGSRWLQAPVQVCKQPRVRGFALAIWPSCRGPRLPAATELAVVPSTTPGSPSSAAWPARLCCVSSCHIVGSADLRAFHSVPSEASLRAGLPDPDSTHPSGAAFLIKYGADPLIGPKSATGDRKGALAHSTQGESRTKRSANLPR